MLTEQYCIHCVETLFMNMLAKNNIPFVLCQKISFAFKSCWGVIFDFIYHFYQCTVLKDNCYSFQ